MLGPTASRTNKSIGNVTSTSAAAIAETVDDVFQKKQKKGRDQGGTHRGS